MNTNMDNYNSEDQVEICFREILKQIINYNSIEVDQLKLLCYTLYKDQTSEQSNKKIFNLIISIFSYITPDTKVYKTLSDNYEIDLSTIYNTYINKEIKTIFEE